MATNTNDTTRDPKDAHDALAEKLYEREKHPLPEVSGRMYSYSPADEAFKSRNTALFTQAGMSPASVQEQRKAFAAIERETGLPDVLVGKLASATIDAMLSAAKLRDDDEADRVAVKRLDADTKETRERLATLYGENEAHDLINRAHRFVKSNARLAKIFKDHAIGSRPDIVLALVEHVRSSGWGRQSSR